MLDLSRPPKLLCLLNWRTRFLSCNIMRSAHSFGTDLWSIWVSCLMVCRFRVEWSFSRESFKIFLKDPDGILQMFFKFLSTFICNYLFVFLYISPAETLKYISDRNSFNALLSESIPIREIYTLNAYCELNPCALKAFIDRTEK